VFYADLTNHIVGVIVNMLTLSVVDQGTESGQVKLKTIKLVFVSSPLSMQQLEQKQVDS
jgi:hypothetical protein